jgi:hypothetical protein
MQATPFTFVAIVFLFKIRLKSPAYLLILLVATHLVWFLVFPDYYQHIQKYLKLFSVTIILFMYWLYSLKRWKFLGYFIIFISFILQGLMLNYFLSDVQVD